MCASSSEPKANKALGQHFLHDNNILARIAGACGNLAGTTVLEIGPGAGALTKHLLQAGATVVAVEKDERFLPLLAELSAEFEGRLTVKHADALKTDFKTLVPKGSVLAGNLPYNVGTEIVLRVVKQDGTYFKNLVFLLQKEVVERICAQPNTKAWGRLSVWADLFTRRSKLFDVAAGCFNPPPKVTSSVCLLVPNAELKYPVDIQKLDKILRILFTQRRKMLRKSLKGIFTEIELEALGISPTVRPDTLSTEQFCLLANKLKGQNFPMR